MTTVDKVRIVLSELTNTLYIATKTTKRQLTKDELDLIKYKQQLDNTDDGRCKECSLKYEYCKCNLKYMQVKL